MAQKTVGYGETPCRSWSKERHADTPKSLAYSAWVLGFVSGVNAISILQSDASSDFLGARPAQEMIRLVDAHCAAYPNDNLDSAAQPARLCFAQARAAEASPVLFLQLPNQSKVTRRRALNFKSARNLPQAPRVVGVAAARVSPAPALLRMDKAPLQPGSPPRVGLSSGSDPLSPFLARQRWLRLSASRNHAVRRMPLSLW
jgi:hypothetical protein